MPAGPYTIARSKREIFNGRKVIYVASSLDDDVDAAQAVAGFLSAMSVSTEFRTVRQRRMGDSEY